MIHIVKPGETLFTIAEMHHTTVEELLRRNPQITDPCGLCPGQAIVIPHHVHPQPVPTQPVQTQLVHCPVLQQGSTGPSVVVLQTALRNSGFDPGPIDGIFGPMTHAAVIAFQQSKGLVVDGIVGPKTWAALGVPCTAPPPPPVPCPVLQQGSTGPSVVVLQTALRNSGFNPGPIDGIFGPMTHAAVIAFQQSKGLVVDGIVGPKTWAALGVPCTAPPPPPPPPVPCPVLQQGSTGPAVVVLQTALRNSGFDPGPIDGIFGPKTNAAVLAFQKSKGLVVDGIVGPKTWAALGVPCTSPPPPPPNICPTLRLGSTGPDVRRLQQLLIANGFSPGAVDGIFGSKTQAAVMAFQKSKGLVVDGIVGVKTWTALGVNCR
jgi:peptidoglycan hydrolase-like protein with peptidoglycan-binding domain